MRKLRILILPLSLCMGLVGELHANDCFDVLKDIAGNVPVLSQASSLVSCITGNSLDNKLDRIEYRQKNSLDRIRKIAYNALETKRKIEDIYYFTKWGIEEAHSLAEGLKKGKMSNFLGVMLEQGLGIPINPAEYIPDIPETQELKRNLDWDLSAERSLLGRVDYLLHGTRSALMRTGLFETNPKRFEQEYEKSLVYEARLEKALRAKKNARVKIYKVEAERLRKEIRLLERMKARKGLKVGDVMLIEQTIDDKRRDLLYLNEQIDQHLSGSLELLEEDHFKLAVYKANRDAAQLSEELERDRRNMRVKYSYLWRF